MDPTTLKCPVCKATLRSGKSDDPKITTHERLYCSRVGCQKMVAPVRSTPKATFR